MEQVGTSKQLKKYNIYARFVWENFEVHSTSTFAKDTEN